jgi:3'(2'), 5'-bisphosphate nucleotidase
MINIEIAVNAALQAGNEILKIYNSQDFEIKLKKDNSPITEADINSNNKIIEILKKTEIPVVSEESEILSFKKRQKNETFWLVDPLDGTKEFIKRNGEFTINIALIENGISIAGIIYSPVSKELYFANDKIGAFKTVNIFSKENQYYNINDLIEKSIKLPIFENRNSFVVLKSKSHNSFKNDEFIKFLSSKYSNLEILEKGSSLKICILAEGKADIYPRFGPTSEWDTAAGHAILKASGGNIFDAHAKKEIIYNKKNILNPDFVAVRNINEIKF